jgi:hypothetical protein
MLTGTVNAHKTAVFEGIDLEWVDLQKKNNEMEFQKWMEFLIVVFCAVYRIDPSELGFNFQGQSVFGQDGQKQRLEHSKSKGLVPILKFLEKYITRHIVEEINPDFEFTFTGLDIEDEGMKIEMDVKKSQAGFVSFEDMFEKYSGRKYNEKKDTILNQVFLQAKQGGNPAFNEMVEQDAQENEGNPFSSFGKAISENPIAQEAMKKVNDILNS